MSPQDLIEFRTIFGFSQEDFASILTQLIPLRGKLNDEITLQNLIDYECGLMPIPDSISQFYLSLNKHSKPNL